MLKNKKLWFWIVFFLVLGVLVKMFLPFSVDAVKASVSIAPEVLFEIGGFPVTPTLLTSIVVFIIITLLAILPTRNLQLIPSGGQNVMEAVIEALINLFQGIAGDAWPKFFTIAATIFILVIVSNFIGLVPGAGSIGVIEIRPEIGMSVEGNQIYFDHDGKKSPSGIFVFADTPLQPYDLYTKRQIENGAPQQQAEHASLVPFSRAPTTDINLPLALALVSVIMTQVYGVQAQGGRYFTRFFSFGRLFKGQIAMGLIDVFVGLVELISEIAKILSFTFRLFGNIFAGEVILLVMAFLFLVLPFPFYGLEFFVAFIQAFVFAVLTLAFMRIATAEHGSDSHEAEAHH